MKLTQEQVDDLIDEWHTSDSKLELHEYLGWSLYEYRMWVSDPTLIPERTENDQSL
jgi:hypothetical protein